MNNFVKKYSNLFWVNKNEISKKTLYLFAYVYIYFGLIYITWKFYYKMSILGFDIIDLFFIFIALTFFVITFIYKKNELYLIIFLILVLQFFV